MDKKGARSTVKILSSEMTSTVYALEKRMRCFQRRGRAKSLQTQYVREERKLKHLRKAGMSDGRATAWCRALLFCSRRRLETLGKDI